MSCKSFQFQTKILKFWAFVLVLIAIVFIQISEGIWWQYLLSISIFFLALILWAIPPAKILLNDLGVKIIYRGISSGKLINKFLRSNSECKWEWVYETSSYRGSNGKFYTQLYYSSDPNINININNIEGSKFENGCVSVDSTLLKENDYIEIIKEVKNKAINSTFDRSTEKISNNELSLKSARIFFYILLVLVTLVSFLAVFFKYA